MTAHTLDTSGLICPMPVLRARKVLLGLSGGDVLEVTATDPNTLKDFPLFCKESGYRLLDSRQDAGRYYFSIEKAPDQP